MLRFHGSRDKKDFESVGYNSRLDELQAAVLRLFLGEIDGWNAARREAAARYEELGLGELCELPADEPGHVYHMYVVRSPERDRFREALAAAGIGNASYYVTPLHLQPALRYLGWQAGLAAGDREGRAREPRAADVGRDPGRDAGARRERDPRGRGGARVIPVNRHRIWQLVADACLIALAWWLAFELRFDQGVPVYYDTLFKRTILIVVAIKLVVFVLFGFYNRWWRYVSTRDMWRRARGVTRGGGRVEPDRLLLLAGRAGAAAALGRDHGLAAAARLRRGLAAARAHVIERPGDGARRARQGGAGRRRRRRGPARDPRDAAQPRSSATRRSA